MIFSLATGNQLPLSFQSFNYNSGLYVQAFLLDQNNQPIVGSPVQLTAGSNGIYTNNSILMPSGTQWVVAQYVCYSDPGYSTLSTAAGAGLDTFINVELLPGGLLPLYMQLYDYNSSKYIKAYVQDGSGNALPASPWYLSPIGSFGLYGAVGQVPNSGSANAQYIVYDDSGYTTISASEGAGNDVFTVGAALFFLELGGLPDVRDALQNYFVPLSLVKVIKDIQQFQVVEVGYVTQFRGMWVPSGKRLDIQPRGQRSWAYSEVYTTPGVPLEPDDIINYKAQQYRIMEKLDYSLYGYLQYKVIEDYTGSGVSGNEAASTYYLLTQSGDFITTQSGQRITLGHQNIVLRPSKDLLAQSGSVINTQGGGPITQQ